MGTRYGNLEVIREWRAPYLRPGKPPRTIPMCEAKCLLCGSDLIKFIKFFYVLTYVDDIDGSQLSKFFVPITPSCCLNHIIQPCF